MNGPTNAAYCNKRVLIFFPPITESWVTGVTTVLDLEILTIFTFEEIEEMNYFCTKTKEETIIISLSIPDVWIPNCYNFSQLIPTPF